MGYKSFLFQIWSVDWWIIKAGYLQFLIAVGFIWISEIWRSQRLLWADLDPCILTILVLCCYTYIVQRLTDICAPGCWTSMPLTVGYPCTWSRGSLTSLHLVVGPVLLVDRWTSALLAVGHQCTWLGYCTSVHLAAEQLTRGSKLIMFYIKW